MWRRSYRAHLATAGAASDPLGLARFSFGVDAAAFALTGDGHLFIGETDTIIGDDPTR